jgi:hypothetical protein
MEAKLLSLQLPLVECMAGNKIAYLVYCSRDSDVKALEL